MRLTVLDFIQWLGKHPQRAHLLDVLCSVPAGVGGPDFRITIDLDVHRRHAAGPIAPGRLMAVIDREDNAARVHEGYKSPEWLLKLNVSNAKDPRSLPRTTASTVAPPKNRSSSFKPGWDGGQTPLK